MQPNLRRSEKWEGNMINHDRDKTFRRAIHSDYGENIPSDEDIQDAIRKVNYALDELYRVVYTKGWKREANGLEQLDKQFFHIFRRHPWLTWGIF